MGYSLQQSWSLAPQHTSVKDAEGQEHVNPGSTEPQTLLLTLYSTALPLSSSFSPELPKDSNRLI